MRVKESEKSSPLTLANRRGQAAFPAPLSVHVGLDAVEDESTMGEVAGRVLQCMRAVCE